MEIYLVRHGAAEDISAAQEAGRGESERRLTHEGREKTSRIAHSFRKRILKVDVIFHSSYARAVETAKIFAQEFPEARLEMAKCLAPHDKPSRALSLMEDSGLSKCTMIVGHEPHLSFLAGLLLTGQELPILEFKKAGIAGIECQGSLQNCRLNFLLTPKFL